jgi:rubrerythrin
VNIIATLKRLAKTDDDDRLVCVCGDCGTRYDANQHACPVCAEFSIEREAWRSGSESEFERSP